MTAAGVSVLDWPTAYTLCSQFIDAEVYLAEKKVLHRNVKPDKVLMRADGSLCLCGFDDAIKACASATRSYWCRHHGRLGCTGRDSLTF